MTEEVVVTKTCENCLINQIIGLMAEWPDAQNELLTFYCITCADCSIPSMEHNWSRGFPRDEVEQ